MGHAITYRYVACAVCIGRPLNKVLFNENRERELGLDRRETG